MLSQAIPRPGGPPRSPAVESRPPAISRVAGHTATELDQLIDFEILCGQAEGKSPRTIELNVLAIRKLQEFLRQHYMPTDAALISAREIREYILHLRSLPCFTNHPYARCQAKTLSDDTISIYLRSLRAAWNRWLSEGLVAESPFSRVKIRKAPKKIIPTFSVEQLARLFGVIDSSTPTGLRDLALLNLYLDTMARLSEITDLEIDDIELNQGTARITAKGGVERKVPFGITVRKLLWKYIHQYRPQPEMPGRNYLFLTADGRHLTNKRVQAIVKKYAVRAGISGVRCSPHTFRHTGCLFWVRNGGDLFSLQQVTGHSSLNVLRNYVNLSDSDVGEAHRHYSPVDNLQTKSAYKHNQTKHKSRGG